MGTGVPVLWVNPRVVSLEGGWLGQDEPEEGGWKMEEGGRSSTPETRMVVGIPTAEGRKAHSPVNQQIVAGEPAVS